MPAAGAPPRALRFSDSVLRTRTFKRDPSGKRQALVHRTATPHPSAGRGGLEYAVDALEGVQEGEEIDDGKLQDPRLLRALVSRIDRDGKQKVKVRARKGQGSRAGQR